MTYNVVQRIGNNYYLYSVEGKWDPEKKNSKQKRRYIGPCDKDGNPIPSKRAKRVDPVTTDTEQKRIPFRAYCFGTYDVLYRVASSGRIVESLHHAFDRDEADTILTLAIMMVADPCSLRTMEDAVESTYLRRLIGTDISLASQRLSESLSYIGTDEDARCRYAEHMLYDSDVVIFDTTVLLTESKGVDMAEIGRKAKKAGMPQVNMGFVHSLKYMVPCHMKLFPGSINDVTTIMNLAEELPLICSSVSMIVMDRGFYSERNIRKLYSKDIGFLMPIPSSKRIFKTAISQSRKDLENPVNTFRFNGRTESYSDMTMDMPFKDIVDGNGDPVKSVRVLVFLNFDREKDELDTLYEDLDIIESRVKDDMEYDEDNISSVFYGKSKRRSLFTIKEGPEGNLVLERNRNAITFAARNCGKLVLLTTSKEEPKKVLDIYTQRNWIEVDYEVLKTYVEGGLDYVRSDASAKGLMFVQMIATAIRMRLSEMIRDTDLKDMGIPMMVRRLNTLHVCEDASGRRLSEVTKKHRTIYEQLGFGEPTLHT